MPLPEKPANVCLLGATYSTGNLGVSALTHSALELILEQAPGACVAILDYHRTRGEYEVSFNGKSIRVLNMRFSKKVFRSNHIVRLLLRALSLRLFPFTRLREKVLSREPLLRVLSGFDLFAAVSGGDSFSDIYGLKRFFYMALPQILAILLDRPLVQLPQTYGPFNRRVSRLVARYILGHSALVYSRDYEGLEQARKFSGARSPSRIRFCYDMAFALSPVRPEGNLGGFETFRKENDTVVGVNVNGLLFREAERNPFGLRSAYPDVVRTVIRTFLEDLDAVVVLVPHVYEGSGRTSQSDLEASRAVARELAPVYGDRLLLLEEIYDQNGIKYIIGACDFFAGSRMHSCIAALSQNVPAAGLAYSGKFVGVFSTIDLTDAVVDLRTSDRDAVRSELRALFARRTELIERLRGKNAVITGTLREEFGHILGMAGVRALTEK